MAPPTPVDVETPNILELIKSNARALYGRHFTYDVITAQPPFSGVPWSPDYTDTKVHVLLVAYPLSDPSAKAKIIKGAVSIGKKNVAPNMSAALRELWRMLQRDMAAFTDRLVKDLEFEAPLLRIREGGGGEGEGEGEVGGKKDVDEMIVGKSLEDDIDGITLRGD